MKELLPCPFCNGPALAVNIKNNDPKDEKVYRVVCMECLARSARGYDENHVKNLWNKRTLSENES